MEARFRALEPFTLPRRNLLAVPGEILDGHPIVGMTAELRDEGEVVFRDKLHGIEFLDEERARGRPCLTFEYRDDAQAASWSAVRWDGREVRLHL